MRNRKWRRHEEPQAAPAAFLNLRQGPRSLVQRNSRSQLCAIVPLHVLHLVGVEQDFVAGGASNAANHELAGAVATDRPRLRADNLHVTDLGGIKQQAWKSR